MLDWVPGAAVNILGGLLVAGLGIVVVAVAPQRRVNRAFLLLSSGLGVGVGLTNVWFAHRPALNLVVGLLFCTLFLAGAAGALWLAHEAGRREDDVLWPTMVGVLVTALAIGPALLVTSLRYATLDDAYYQAWNGVPPSAGFPSGYILPFFVLVGAVVGAVATLTIRAARIGRSDPARVRGLALLAAAIPLFPGFAAGALALAPDARMWAYSAGALPVILGLAGAWLVLSARGPEPAAARNVSLLLLAAPLLGLIFSAIGLGNQGGTVRLVSASILAYGILRHQLLDIDVKLRWGISRTTVAAVFLAVFFAVSEGAQQFFGETLGGTYAGIAAAGALVFAMAPLQRAAERLAERAVPLASVPASPAASNAEAVYKAALRAAMREGGVTRREERHLAEVARGLGVDPVQAHEWRDEVEREPTTLA